MSTGSPERGQSSGGLPVPLDGLLGEASEGDAAAGEWDEGEQEWEEAEQQWNEEAAAQRQQQEQQGGEEAAMQDAEQPAAEEGEEAAQDVRQDASAGELQQGEEGFAEEAHGYQQPMEQEQPEQQGYEPPADEQQQLEQQQQQQQQSGGSGPPPEEGGEDGDAAAQEALEAAQHKLNELEAQLRQPDAVGMLRCACRGLCQLAGRGFGTEAAARCKFPHAVLRPWPAPSLPPAAPSLRLPRRAATDVRASQP